MKTFTESLFLTQITQMTQISQRMQRTQRKQSLQNISKCRHADISFYNVIQKAGSYTT